MPGDTQSVANVGHILLARDAGDCRKSIGCALTMYYEKLIKGLQKVIGMANFVRHPD